MTGADLIDRLPAAAFAFCMAAALAAASSRDLFRRALAGALAWAGAVSLAPPAQAGLAAAVGGFGAILALALAVRTREAFGTLEADEVAAEEDRADRREREP